MSDRLADQDARDRIEQDLATTFVVEAAAGTGKTTALVRRIVAVVASGAGTLAELVAVTFTDAAAGELKLRLRTALERARQDPACDPAARDRLTAALPQLEEARIGTIHSFCGDLLRERPVEARVDPSFQVAAGDQAAVLFDRAFDRWFEEQLAAPPEGVRRILRRRLRFDAGPRARLRQAAFELAQWRDFPAPWRRQPFARDPAIDALLDEMAALARWAGQGEPDDAFTRGLKEIARFTDDVARHERVRGARDYDGLEAELVRVSRDRHWKWAGFQRSTAPDFPKAQLRRERDALHERLQAFVEHVGGDIAPHLQAELGAVVERYEVLKARGGYVDFLDLLLRARDLIRDDAAVRAALQQRFRHIFVDEFQDTDPVQAELVLLLASADPAERDWRRVQPVPGKLFVVGDPKQSIYRFRRADVALYQTIKEQLVGVGAVVLHLCVSFRSVPALQGAINAAFAPCMQARTPSEAAYVALVPHRAPRGTQPAVVALPVPRPYGDYRKVVDWKIDASLPDAVAAYVDWLVRDSGWTVSERDEPAVPIRPRHVCILFRRFRSWNDDVTRPYVRGLEARHLPHVLVGGTSFHQREEIAALRNALAAIERPEDELMVFATLHGPLFALTDAQLLAWRDQLQTLHPFRQTPADLPPSLVEVAAALSVLRELHRDRNRRPIAETIGRLLAATRAHAALAIWPTGEQALANVARLMDTARRAERTGVSSFRGFVDRLFDEAAHGDAGEAPVVEEGTEGVRLMTVHKAKGLEFPVVILADLTANGVPREPSRWVDPAARMCALRIAGCAPVELLEHAAAEIAREEEEGARLLYVAATRARDLLVVPAVGDGPHPGWLAPLHPVIYPAIEETRAPVTAAPAGCPAFGAETIVARPANVRRPLEAVVPGEHRPQAGEHMVIWWDPNLLRLEVQETVGLRQQKFLEADEGGRQSNAGLEAHAAWQTARSQMRAIAARPAVAVVTATEHAEQRSGAPGMAVAIEDVPRAAGRPHGKRFGALVHAVLATVDWSAPGTGVDEMATLTGRLFGATADECAAASETVRRALQHPLVQRAAAGACWRETPLAIHLDDGTLVEGVVDAAFEDADGWTVIDFKTDVELDGRLDTYRRQVALYAQAIAAATGRPARPVLLRL